MTAALLEQITAALARGHFSDAADAADELAERLDNGALAPSPMAQRSGGIYCTRDNLWALATSWRALADLPEESR